MVKRIGHIPETVIAKKIIDWLAAQNWEIYQEVEFRGSGGVADIVAVRNGVVWIVETKSTFGFAVLEQAAAWPVHYRSVGVPYAKERNYRVAVDYYRVGVIEVYSDDYDPVRERISAPLFIRRHGLQHVTRMRDQLTDLHKTYSEAGKRGGGHLTPYKRTMIEVRKAIADDPGCTIKDLYAKLGKMHYSTAASFKGNVLDALASFEGDWCRVDQTERPFKLYVREDAPPEFGSSRDINDRVVA